MSWSNDKKVLSAQICVSMTNNFLTKDKFQALEAGLSTGLVSMGKDSSKFGSGGWGA